MSRNKSRRDKVKANENASYEAVVITERGLVLPAKGAPGQASNPLGPRDRIALRARNDGHIEFADELGACLESCPAG